jgi:ATP-binding protein involved in chromosome partitioning
MKRYSDLAGQSTSGIVEQVVARHERQEKALAGVKHLLAVGSGKGGVGKSTVAMGLAQGFRANGQSVAILDADLNGPTQARMAGLEGQPWVPDEEGHVALPRRGDGLGVASVGSVLPDGEALEFASRARGDEQTWRGTREFTLLGDILSTVEWGELDVLVVDLPPGAAHTTHFAGLLGPKAQFVLVTIPAGVARQVVERSVAALDQIDRPALGYIENMSGYRCPGCGEVHPLFPQAKKPLPIARLGTLPFDPELAELCDAGWPEDADRARATRGQFAELGAKLWTRLQEASTAPSKD